MSELAFYLVIFLSNIIQGITGFAGTILAMPFSIRLVGYPVAKPVLNVLGILAGIYVLVSGHRSINRRELERVSVFMGIGIAAGILLRNLSAGYERVMYLVLGVFVVGVGLKGLWTSRPQRCPKDDLAEKGAREAAEEAGKEVGKEGTALGEQKAAQQRLAAGAAALLLIAGAVHGIFVCGGPLVITYLTRHTGSKEEFRQTISAVWVILNTVILFSDVTAGYYSAGTVRIQLIAVPFLFGGMLVGSALFRRMSRSVFMTLTYFLLCLAGGSLFFK